MILGSLSIPVEAFERRTGWAFRSEGLCKGDVCVPLPDAEDARVLDARVLSQRLHMPLIHDECHDLWCLGPEAGGRALATADLPDIELPDYEGSPYRLRSLLGRKVLLVAWASW